MHPGHPQLLHPKSIHANSWLSSRTIASALRYCCLVFILGIFPLQSYLQNPSSRLEQLTRELTILDDRRQVLLGQIEQAKWDIWRQQVKNLSPRLLSGDRFIEHTALCLAYASDQGLTRWVGHVIAPAIRDGNIGRQGGFRSDPKLPGSRFADASGRVAVPPGFERGHLAPAADFRWSELGLAESYYATNIAPQLPAFNRGIWSELEELLRYYVYRRGDTGYLIVFTGPVLANSSRGSSSSIPTAFWKVAYDPQAGQAVAFLIPHQSQTQSLEAYWISIDALEASTGLDFLASLPDAIEARIESQVNRQHWLAQPAPAGGLSTANRQYWPAGAMDVASARELKGQNKPITVCGPVVAARLSNKGNGIINLEQAYPDERFNLFIPEASLPLFSFDPVTGLRNLDVCATGDLIRLSGIPTITITRESQLQILPAR